MKRHVSSGPIAVDLYAGVGGLSLGLAQSGFRVRFAVEIDPLTARYLQFNHPETQVLQTSVRPKVVKAIKGAFPIGSEITVVAGGPPCQGFSHAGRHATGDDRNREMVHFADLVARIAPRAFLFENVTGILSHGEAELALAIRHFRKTYALTDPTVLDASQFGVPQARKRVFLLGIRKDLGIEPSLPTATHSLRPSRGSGLASTPTVSDAIDDLPVASWNEQRAAQGIPYSRRPHSSYARAMRGDHKDRTDHSTRVLWDDAYCTNAVATRHGWNVKRRFKRLAFGEEDSVSGLRRLDPNGVSFTIRAGTTEEFGSRSAPRPVHPHEDRVLTTREGARIQSFPDHYVFHPTLWHGNRQVGNAVPPLLARAIGRHILDLLGVDPKTRPSSSVSRDARLVSKEFAAAPWLDVRVLG